MGQEPPKIMSAIDRSRLSIFGPSQRSALNTICLGGPFIDAKFFHFIEECLIVDT